MSDEIEEVRGREVVIRFEGRKCLHSRNSASRSATGSHRRIGFTAD